MLQHFIMKPISATVDAPVALASNAPTRYHDTPPSLPALSATENVTRHTFPVLPATENVTRHTFPAPVKMYFSSSLCQELKMKPATHSQRRYTRLRAALPEICSETRRSLSVDMPTGLLLCPQCTSIMKPGVSRRACLCRQCPSIS